MNKYVKQLKKTKINTITELEESDSEENSKKIFFKYLKALSSRATIILVKFSRPELKTLMGGASIKIKSASKLSEVMFDEKTDNKEQRVLSQPDYFLEHVILLETRLAKNIPNYDYSKMKTDEKVIQFEKTVQ